MRSQMGSVIAWRLIRRCVLGLAAVAAVPAALAVGCHDLGAIKPAVTSGSGGAAGNVAATGGAGAAAGAGGGGGAGGTGTSPCQTELQCPQTGVCLTATHTCAPQMVAMGGHVRNYDKTDPASFRPGVTVRITSATPIIMSPPSGADGSYRLPAIDRGTLLDIELVFPQSIGVTTTSVPPAVRTRFTSLLPDTPDQAVDLPLVTYAWMAQVAAQCGIFPTLADAVSVNGDVNTYFTQRSTIFGRLVDTAGNPRAGVAARDVQVVLDTTINNVATTFVNSDPNPNDTDPHPAKVCFLIEDPEAGAYAGSSSPTSTASGRFVMFRVRNERGTGEGKAGVHATGFASKSVILLSTGNIGVVELAEGVDPMPPVTAPARSFTTDVYPLFARLGCRGCHTPGQPGYETSMLRGGMHLDLSGTPEQAYMSITSGGFDGCATTPTRVCPPLPPASLLLKKPLVEQPPDVPDHANSSFDTTNDPNYQVILQWIQQGARF